jgi:cell division protein FtsA
MSSVLSRGLAPRMRPLHKRRTAVVAALDVGTSKIACMIARLKPRGREPGLDGRTHSIGVMGIGHTRARGVKSGHVVDLALAEEAIRTALDAAERAAKVEIAAVALATSGGRLGSESFAASLRLPGASVEEGDIGRVQDAASLHSVRGGRAVLHSLPVGYGIDGTAGIRDPRGMLGQVLSVDLHVVTADLPPLKNLLLCVERCHLSVEGLIAAPYAAGLGVLAADEAEMGATVLDLGNGTTTAAVFAGGDCVHVDGIALGGSHVTMDLARGLSTGAAEAERLKTLHGSVLSGTSDEHDMVTVRGVGDDPRESANAVSRAQIFRLIRPRVEELVELIRDRLKAANMLAAANRRIVLTGGGAQLTGLAELVGRVFGTTTRIGRPLGMLDLSEAARSPAFAVCAGLIAYAQFAGREHFEPRRRYARGETGYLTRVGRWLKESF